MMGKGKHPLEYFRQDNLSDGDPVVSVIIPVRDDRAGIGRVLACLSAQTLPRTSFEVIVADDGSSPESAPRAEDLDGLARIVTLPPRTSYAARNAAVDIARGRVLAFCDSDCLPEPEWLEEALGLLRDTDIVAGEVTLTPPARPTVWSLLTVDMFLDQEQNVELSRGVTANLVVRRVLFDRIGGFDESLPSGGDYDFVRRAVECGMNLRYGARAIVRHPTMDKGRAFLRKVWRTNRWAAVRHSRDGERIDLLGPLIFIPIFGVAIARRRALRPALRLYRPRFARSGLTLGVVDEGLGVVILHFAVSSVAGIGLLCGWFEGWWLARTGERPQYRVLPSETVSDEVG